MAKTTILFFDSSSHWSSTCQEKFNGVRRFAATRNWTVIRKILPPVPAPDRIRQLLADLSPRGCLVNATRFGNTLPSGLFGTIPVVYLDTDPDLFDDRTTVIPHDSFETGRRAAQVLLSLGLRHFYFTPYRFKAYWSDRRWNGFSDFLSENGFTARLLPIRSSKIPDEIGSATGIMTANDEMAERLLPILKRRGLRIPQDIAIVSADDSDIARNNGLTSIRIDFEQGGYCAAQTLANLIERRPCSARTYYGDVCIQYRESTRHFAHTLPRIPEAVSLIRTRACNGLSAADVVAFIGTSRRTAEEHFRLATGHSILQEIQSVRMDRAFNLLASAEQSISDLTELCGYATPQALRKAFRLHAGVSMKEWKRREFQSKPQSGRIPDLS